MVASSVKIILIYESFLMNICDRDTNNKFYEYYKITKVSNAINVRLFVSQMKAVYFTTFSNSPTPWIYIMCGKFRSAMCIAIIWTLGKRRWSNFIYLMYFKDIFTWTFLKCFVYYIVRLLNFPKAHAYCFLLSKMTLLICTFIVRTLYFV